MNENIVPEIITPDEEDRLRSEAMKELEAELLKGMPDEMNPEEFIPADEVFREIEETIEKSSIENSREKLLCVIRKKTPSAAADFVIMSLMPMIENLSAEDCENMANIIETKGLAGALRMGKKMKKKIQKNGEDPNEGRIG